MQEITRQYSDEAGDANLEEAFFRATADPQG
jgi:hypothetical protein